jgi:hypothetical protein
VTIFGIDVSHYQAGINMARVAAEGFDFVIGKVSQGSTYRSPCWAAQRDGARNAGMIVAGYHFVDTSPAAAQAANCLAALGDPTLPVALDWENGGGDWANYIRVLAAFRAAGIRVVLGYLPHWYWATEGSPDIAPTGLPLWSSRYPSTRQTTAAAQYGAVILRDWDGYGGADVGLLQFSASAHVAGHTCDASAFRGTREQLLALFHSAAPLPGPAPSDPARGEEDSMPSIFVQTPAPADPKAPKSAWPTQRLSFGFDPINGWGGRCVVKLHWSQPGGFISQAIWWVRPGGGVGTPNVPHNPVGINVAGLQERYVGLGWEIAPPSGADELDLVVAAPGGLHIFTVYER